MANTISIDTLLLEDLARQIQQLQRSLDATSEKTGRSISEVRRVASGQDGLIRKLQTIQRNVQKTAERAEKLSRATQLAADRWEEAEKKISSQNLPQASDPFQGSGSSGSSGTGSSAEKTESGKWMSGILNFTFRKLTVPGMIYESVHNGLEFANVILHLMNGEDYTSGEISEFNRNGEWLWGHGNSSFSEWNNDYINVSWREVEIFGQKVTIPAPYINYGSGVSGNAAHVSSGDLLPGGTLEGGFLQGYLGDRVEIGFNEEGKFIFHIGGGAEASVFSVSGGADGKYVDVSVSHDSISAGGHFFIDYRDGKLTIDGMAGLVEGVDAKITVDAGAWVNDAWSAAESATQGDFGPAAEMVWEAIKNTNPIYWSASNVIESIGRFFS